MPYPIYRPNHLLVSYSSQKVIMNITQKPVTKRFRHKQICVVKISYNVLVRHMTYHNTAHNVICCHKTYDQESIQEKKRIYLTIHMNHLSNSDIFV